VYPKAVQASRCSPKLEIIHRQSDQSFNIFLVDCLSFFGANNGALLIMCGLSALDLDLNTSKSDNGTNFALRKLQVNIEVKSTIIY